MGGTTTARRTGRRSIRIGLFAVTALLIAACAPAKPGNVTATPATVTVVPGASSATVSWTAPAPHPAIPEILGYVVGYGTTELVFDDTATTQTITGLTNGETYTFWVSAFNAVGTGQARYAAPVTLLVPAIYVDQAATGANNGTSWPNAYTDLQDALAAASRDDLIVVAEGTYRPAASDRTVSFDLSSHVTLRGGFQTGGAAGPDPAAYPTILSGDLADNDLPGFVNNGENSYHVVTAESLSGAVIDGFTIAGGNANGVATDRSGGGLYVLGGSPAVLNSTVSNNSADAFGGGVWIDEGNSPSIVNTQVIDNRVTQVLGAGLAVTQGNAVSILNSVVARNTTPGIGGGLYVDVASPSITNTVVAANVAGETGGIGGIWCTACGGSATFTNLIVWGNVPDGIDDKFADESVVSHSVVQGGWPGVANIDLDPLFVGPGNYRLTAASPARNTGDNTAVPADIFDVDGDGDTTEPTPDLNLNPRIAEITIDMGAFEFQP